MGVFFSDEEISRMTGSKSVPKPPSCATFIFGAGYCGQRFVRMRPDIPGLLGFLDNNTALDGTFVEGQEVYHPSRMTVACAGGAPVAILAAMDRRVRESMRQDCLRLGIECDDTWFAENSVNYGMGGGIYPTVEELLNDTSEAEYFYGDIRQLSSLLQKMKCLKNFKGVLDPYCDENAAEVECQPGIFALHPSIPRKRGERAKVFSLVYCDKAYLERFYADCQNYGYKPISGNMLYLAASHHNNVPAFYETCEPALKCLDIWSDYESRYIYTSLIRTRCCRSLAFCPASNEEEQFFSPIVPKKFYRSFVDCGAHKGGTLNHFRRVIGDDFDDYYAFEPFSSDYRDLIREANADPRIHCWNMALWNKKTELSFRVPIGGVDNSFCCYVEQNGNAIIQGDSLDRILGDRPVTIITMDIEGAEPEVLEGAIEIIRRQRPALAISTYHYDADENESHLWRIPLWIHELDLGYSLYCRHYSNNLNETVCYAVPNE